ncbi:MAG: tyrosine-protein phosphatase, partial [Spirochaetaceae bacterium]|nr:tyrosine-protein phosphatase [Spirochaetaceae bacterium]
MKFKLQGMILFSMIASILFTGCFSTSRSSSIYVDRTEVEYQNIPVIPSVEKIVVEPVIDIPKQLTTFQTSLDRDDYLSDKAFANFREIRFGSIKKGILYRSSNLTSYTARSSYSSELAKSYNIKNIINLSDSNKSVEKNLILLPNPWYQGLFDANKVLALGLTNEYNSESFNKNIAEAFVFIIDNEGPILIQGSDGVDRVGFMSIIIESLMGASMEEIETDYMTSFYNLFNVKKGSNEFCVVKDTPYEMLSSIADDVEIRDQNLSNIARD